MTHHLAGCQDLPDQVPEKYDASSSRPIGKYQPVEKPSPGSGTNPSTLLAPGLFAFSSSGVFSQPDAQPPL